MATTAKVGKANRISSDAVRAKTGKSWDEWFALLDKAGAGAMTHKEIARYIHDRLGCPPWWSQMVTVGYEQERGLRVPNQGCDGGFQVSVSKTVAVPVAELYRAVADVRRRSRWLPDVKLTVRKATPNKSMRVTGPDETNFDIGFFAKGPAKSQISLEQRKLPDLKAVERQRAWWTAALERLKAAVE